MGRREVLAQRCGEEVCTLPARPERPPETHRRPLSRVEEDGDEQRVRARFSLKRKTSLCCRHTPRRPPLLLLWPRRWPYPPGYGREPPCMGELKQFPEDPPYYFFKAQCLSTR